MSIKNISTLKRCSAFVRVLLITYFSLFVTNSYAHYPDIEKIDFKERVLFFEKNRTLPILVFKNNVPSPTIIIGHPCAGPNILSWPYIVREWGYNVIMPESFTARGYNDICNNPRIVSFESRAEDYDRVVNWLKDKSWHQGPIGIFGFSHGAIGGMYYATNNNKSNKISAVVGYYPHCGYGGHNPNIPVQIHIGELDNWTPANLCALLSSNKNFDINIYPNAHHVFDDAFGVKKMYGFTVGADNSDAYNLALARTKEFFKKHLKN